MTQRATIAQQAIELAGEGPGELAVERFEVDVDREAPQAVDAVRQLGQPVLEVDGPAEGPRRRLQLFDEEAQVPLIGGDEPLDLLELLGAARGRPALPSPGAAPGPGAGGPRR